jgi:Tol biopolymer transport system component
MKAHRMTLVPAVMAVALLTVAAATQDVADPGVRLRAAIETEEVDGDLEAAIAQYRQIVESAGTDRAVAAKALLRLGGCHEKLGQEEAAEAYRRLVDDYPDQVDEVAAARRRLATLAKTAADTTPKPRFRKLVVPSKPRYRSGGMLSPDGTRLAFLAEGAVWTVPVSGQVHPDVAGEPIQLTPEMRAWDNGNATLSWSADGKWISFRTDPKNSLYVVPAAGGEPKLVLEHGGGGQGNLASRASLSPDGTALAFTQLLEEETSDASWPFWARAHVFTVPVQGGDPNLLTHEPAVEPAYSPDGRHVAYISRDPEAPKGATRLVKIVPAKGGTPTLVSRTEGAAVSPFWSPDGRSLAFVVWHWDVDEQPGHHELWIVPLTDEGQPAAEATKIDLNEVTAGSRYGKRGQKYTVLSGWSSRSEIAVFTEVPFEDAIYTVSASGGRATRIALEGREPRWSPDGGRIYFRGHEGIEHVPPEGGESLLVPIRSEEETVVAYPMGSNEISPDGKRIVFAGFSLKTRGGHIFTLPIEGGIPTPITNVDEHEGVDANPCWSPDGRWIAFTRRDEEGPSDWQVLTEIFVVPSAGGAARKLTSESDQVAHSELAWSPDGRWIAYFGEDRTIRLVSPNGGPSRVLSRDESIDPDSAYFNGLSWSPDGRELAYAIPPQGPTIKVVSATGGEPRTVPTGFSGFVTQLAWSPDGQTFAFTGVTGGDEEIWLMSDFLPLGKR